MRWLVDVLVREGVWVGKGCSGGGGVVVEEVRCGGG